MLNNLKFKRGSGSIYVFFNAPIFTSSHKNLPVVPSYDRQRTPCTIFRRWRIACQIRKVQLPFFFASKVGKASSGYIGERRAKEKDVQLYQQADKWFFNLDYSLPKSFLEFIYPSQGILLLSLKCLDLAFSHDSRSFLNVRFFFFFFFFLKKGR